jgi:lysine 2,3-aminomutase
MKSGECITTSRSDANVSNRDWSDWVWQFKHRIQTIPQLARMLGKSTESLAGYMNVTNRYPLCVTPYYLSLMNLADESDPLRLQSFPDIKEICFSLGGMADPLEEEQYMPVPGLIHRYPDRCVAIVANACMTHCRHCNRKRMWLQGKSAKGRQYLQNMIDYIGKTVCLREVIVSGGDPLTLDDEMLEWFLRSLRSIPHVEVLRIGSRAPVLMPMRVTQDLCSMLRRYRPLWFNTQFNHPNEITEESAMACEMLLDVGIPVSNQSVLLRKVNDNYETMRELLYGLQRISVRPYYLFQCDAAEGTDHFRTEIRSGLKMMEKLWESMPGLCLPQYVIDAPREGGKVPLFPFSPMSSIALSAYPQITSPLS